jgi:hypothetical protein
MNQRTEDAIRQESGALFSVQTNLEPNALEPNAAPEVPMTPPPSGVPTP